jgi:general stress protein 26
MYNEKNNALCNTMNDIIKREVFNFLNDNNLGYLATISNENEPHCAAVYYIIEPEFSIYFISKSVSKKVKNILNNPKTAFTVAEKDDIPKTAQMQGTTVQIEANTEIIHKLSVSSLKNNDFFPPSIKLPGSGLSLMKFTPHKIQWVSGNFSNDIEINHIDLQKT